MVTIALAQSCNHAPRPWATTESQKTRDFVRDCAGNPRISPNHSQQLFADILTAGFLSLYPRPPPFLRFHAETWRKPWRRIKPRLNHPTRVAETQNANRAHGAAPGQQPYMPNFGTQEPTQQLPHTNFRPSKVLYNKASKGLRWAPNVSREHLLPGLERMF